MPFLWRPCLGYESPDGTVNETMQEYWLARARGGVGCIITDALSVDPDVPYLGNTLCFRNEESIASYRRFTDRIHEYGTKNNSADHPSGGRRASVHSGGYLLWPAVVYLNSMAQRTKGCNAGGNTGIIQKYAKAHTMPGAPALTGLNCTVPTPICCWDHFYRP